jgi:hypothetical protein
MGIYTDEWLEYIFVIDINPSNTEIILEILRELFEFPSIRTHANVTYISIEKCDEEQLRKIKYYNKYKSAWATTFNDSLVKMDEIYQDDPILDIKNKIEFDKIIGSELKDYILDYGWFKYSCIFTTYDTDPIGRHYLQYIIKVNLKDNPESIQLFKNKIKSTCEKNEISVIPQLYRQKNSGMLFILISELLYKRLYESNYYKHYRPLWDLKKYSMDRIPITKNPDIKFTDCESNLLNVLLASEIASNIESHGWYNVYD